MIVVVLALFAFLALLEGAFLEALGLAVFTLVVWFAVARGVGERPRGIRIWWPGGAWRR